MLIAVVHAYEYIQEEPFFENVTGRETSLFCYGSVLHA